MNDDELRSAFDDLLQDLPGDRVLPRATATRVARRRGLKLGTGALGGAAVLASAAVLVLGTAGPADDRLVPATPPTTSPTPSPSALPGPSASPSSGPTTAGTGAPSQEPTTPVRVVLRPDGLGFTGGGSSTSTLPFGTDAATVRAAVDRALGAGGEMATPDCGPRSSTVQYEGLFLRLQDGELVGWTTGSPGLTTGDGTGVGSTLAELRDAQPGVGVTEGTLGPEWSTEGGLAGFLDGTSDDSLVNSMGAGDQCLAR
jgi:hypothetical protein